MNESGEQAERPRKGRFVVRLGEWPMIALAVLCVVSLYELRFDLILDESGERQAYRHLYFGNITTGDLGLALMGCVLFLRRDYQRFIRRALRTVPGLSLIALVAALVISPLGMGGSLVDNYKQGVQFAFDLTFVVPIFAFAVVSSPDPLRLCRRLGLVYVFLLGVGLLLYFLWDSSLVMRDGGVRRVMPNMGLDALQYLALAYGVTTLTWRSSWHNRLMGVLCLVSFLVAVVVGASRTLFIAFACIAFFVPVIRLLLNGKYRVLLFIAVGGALTFKVYQVIFQGASEQFLVRTDGFNDSVRLELISRGISQLTAAPQYLFFGFGWDTSGIHNFTLQTLLDAGVIVSGLFCLLLFSPAIALWKARHRHPTICLLGGGLLAGFVIQYSLNALPALRVYWIPFGLVMGFALRSQWARAHPTPAI